jgi:NADH:ubiquinone oxidoreductase subunit K
LKQHPFLTGVILGIVSPFAGIFLFYLWKAPSAQFSYFLQTMLASKTLLTAAISFSLLINAIVFTLCVNTRKDKTAKGVFIVTLIITIPAIIYKIFFS